MILKKNLYYDRKRLYKKLKMANLQLRNRTLVNTKKTLLLRLCFSKTTLTFDEIEIIFSFLFHTYKSLNQKVIKSIIHSFNRSTIDIGTNRQYFDSSNFFVGYSEPRQWTDNESWGFTTTYGTSAYFYTANCSYCGGYMNYGEHNKDDENYDNYISYCFYSSSPKCNKNHKRYLTFSSNSFLAQRLFCFCNR